MQQLIAPQERNRVAQIVLAQIQSCFGVDALTNERRVAEMPAPENFKERPANLEIKRAGGIVDQPCRPAIPVRSAG